MDWDFFMLEPIKKIRVTFLGAAESVSVKSVSAFYSEDKYTIVLAGDRKLMVADSLRSMEGRLPDFVRIHRNCLVRKSLIKKLVLIESGNDPKYSIVVGENKLRVSRVNLNKVRSIIEASKKAVA